MKHNDSTFCIFFTIAAFYIQLLVPNLIQLEVVGCILVGICCHWHAWPRVITGSSLTIFFGGGVAQVMKATGVDAKKGEQYFSGVSKINKKKRKAPERSEKQTKNIYSATQSFDV